MFVYYGLVSELPAYLPGQIPISARLTIGVGLQPDLTIRGKIDVAAALAPRISFGADATLVFGTAHGAAGVNALSPPGMVAPPGRLMSPVPGGANGTAPGNVGPPGSETAGMSQQVARLGDTSTHGGKITTAAQNTTAEGKPVSRVGDILNCPIHGKNPIVTGSNQFLTEGAKTARINSRTACNATILSDAQHTIAA